jgi:hypothetical protein
MEKGSTLGVMELHTKANLRMIKCQAKEFGDLIVEINIKVSIIRVKDMDKEDISKEMAKFWKDSLLRVISFKENVKVFLHQKNSLPMIRLMKKDHK